MIKEDEYCSKVIGTKFNKPLEENEAKGVRFEVGGGKITALSKNC